MPVTPVYALPYPAAADPADVPLDMQELAERIEAVIAPAAKAWIAPTLQNGWANAGGVEDTAGYLKDALGSVWIKGTVQAGPGNQPIFTLPAGYRPSFARRHICLAWNGSAYTFTALHINPDGTLVSTQGGPSWQVYLNAVFSLP